MSSPNCWSGQFKAVVETDEESFAEEAGVEVTAGGGKVEIEAGFNSALLEVDSLFASCKVGDVIFLICRQ